MRHANPQEHLSSVAQSFLANYPTTPPAVLSIKALRDRVRQHLRAGELEQNAGMSVDSVIDLLVEDGEVAKLVLRSDAYPSITRYMRGLAPPLVIAASLRPKGYLSHGSAVFLHGLTDEIPGTHYVNVEQSPKPPPEGDLTQPRLAQAFSRPQRASRYVFTHERLNYVILSGKHTGNFGVLDMTTADGQSVRATDLERTLIDIVVRPAYAGGIYQVRRAFDGVSERVSVPRLVETLKALDHVYPYHQALGLLLERAGVATSLLDPLRAMGTTLDFYLTHGMKNPVLDPTWRIYHPKGF